MVVVVEEHDLFICCSVISYKLVLPLDALESFLFVFLAHEETSAPGRVNVEPDPVLLANICGDKKYNGNVCLEIFSFLFHFPLCLGAGD